MYTRRGLHTDVSGIMLTLCGCSTATHCRDGITKEDVAVYRGLLVADQNAKLAAFASRPAVLNYATNTVSKKRIKMRCRLI